MKILLIKDVYKLGRAGDIKKVADGYGRNYLIPQGFAVLATSGALKQVEYIRSKADTQREILNQELSGLADQLKDVRLNFSVRAGETGKLYGSITTQMIAQAIKDKVSVDIDKRQIEVEPIRTLGEHEARIRLTVDLTPAIKILVHREGEAIVEKLAENIPEIIEQDDEISTESVHSNTSPDVNELSEEKN